jgi:hypothetical protein
MTTKTRSWSGCPVQGITRTSTFVPFSNYSDSGPGSSETCVTFSHYRLNGGRWSGGGPFLVQRTRRTWAPNSLTSDKLTGGGSLLGEGTIRLEGPTTGIPVLGLPSVPSDSELSAMGTTAIARTEPLNPAFDLSVFVGELRMEGLPNLPGTAAMEKTRRARALGSEYLNVEFGWSPFIRGIRDFAKTVDDADRIITKHQSLANKVIQRSYEWPVVEDSRADACSHSMTPAWGFFTGGGQSQRTWSRQWFEAEYMFYLPTGSSVNDKLKRYGSYARKLLGVDLSPEVLWNLSPWSWAADWFSNTGDVMHNISALGSDGLVMRHGYIMSHTGRETVRSGNYKGKWQVRTDTDETKRRMAASPFGFGVSYEGLSLRRAAIVAALGLSRW